MNLEVMRAEEEWQRAGAYSVRIQGMNCQHHIPLREEFDAYDGDGTRYIILLDRGYPVATCRFYEHDSKSVILGRVVVLPEYRALGLGRIVIEEAERWIREWDYEKIIIDSRDVAIPFYEKLGYSPVNGKLIKSGSFNCVRMSKTLNLKD